MVDRFSTAWELAAAVRRGEVSALAITEAALGSIARVDATVHAWLRVDEVGALAAARAVDAALARGEPVGPLAGVPAGLKDSFVTAGLETCAGSRILRGWVPPVDGAQAARLRAAGAVILGKLAQDEFAMGSSGEHTPERPTSNPWADGYVPGGSSSGPAAAVASGTACFALGSDTGGSIRQPASLCGVVGLRPTYGRVSRRGLIAFASSLDQAGPIGRDVRDAALVLGCLSGHDPEDSSSLDAPVPDYVAAVMDGRGRGLAGVRIGVDHEALARVGVEDEVARSFAAALAVLVEAGAEVVAVTMAHARHAVATYQVLASAEATSTLARYDGVRFGLRVAGEGLAEMQAATRSAGFGEEVKRRLLLGAYVLAEPSLYEQARRVRRLIADDHAAALERCDVLASPSVATVGLRRGERDALKLHASDALLVGASLAGLPAISLPAGFAGAPRLPIGLHLVAPALAEERLLRVAGAYESRTRWHLERPPEGP
jgi:aspartyl-tRNA(Asn)/glutamyl-tRNA(Gln) amidotransferase subunit A